MKVLQLHVLDNPERPDKSAATPTFVVVDRLLRWEALLKRDRANDVVLDEDGVATSIGTALFLEGSPSPVLVHEHASEVRKLLEADDG